MNANEISDEIGKRKLLLPGEYLESVEVTDDLVQAEIDVSIRYFEGSEAHTDRIVIGSTHVEDAAARLFAYLERRHE